MISKYGFTKYTLAEFEKYINSSKTGRTVLYIQQHHTYSPSYKLFTNNNHFELQKGMKNHHVNTNGWSDIGQHFTTFPDGTIMSGRSMENSPACIYGNNANAICIEHLGNFDEGADAMTLAQKEVIVKMTAILCKKFSVPVSSNRIVYHHWFNLSTGERNNGTKNNKSCPGTHFFGGNKVADCEAKFLPLVQKEVAKMTALAAATNTEYRIVTTNFLNVRKGPSTSHDKVSDRDPISLGAVVRVFDEKDGWLKISSSSAHWISGKYTQKVIRATVNADTLNVREGAGTEFDKTGSLTKGTEVFITEEKSDWSKIGLDMKWVKSSYLNKN